MVLVSENVIALFEPTPFPFISTVIVPEDFPPPANEDLLISLLEIEIVDEAFPVVILVFPPVLLLAVLSPEFACELASFSI